ncbi:MAG: PIN domain-containing protein [Chitinophagales bacterium]
MKIFLDANILISVLNKEYPVFSYSSRILSLNPKKFQLTTSPVCLAIAFYFSSKKSGSKAAKKKIEILMQHINITEINKEIVVDALKDKKVIDFEGGIEYYSALHSGCTCLVTEDNNDFYFSKIPVLGAEQFLQQYL